LYSELYLYFAKHLAATLSHLQMAIWQASLEEAETFIKKKNN